MTPARRAQTSNPAPNPRCPMPTEASVSPGAADARASDDSRASRPSLARLLLRDGEASVWSVGARTSALVPLPAPSAEMRPLARLGLGRRPLVISCCLAVPNQPYTLMLFDCRQMSPRGPHVCPGCGERVSAFAAGCALCGADLDSRRGQRPTTVTEHLRRHLRHLRSLPAGTLRRSEGRRAGGLR